MRAETKKLSFMMFPFKGL